MQFLRTLEGHLIPESEITEIGRRLEPSERKHGDGGGDVSMPFHRVRTRHSDTLEGDRYHVATAREVSRFLKACELPAKGAA